MFTFLGNYTRTRAEEIQAAADYPPATGAPVPTDDATVEELIASDVVGLFRSTGIARDRFNDIYKAWFDEDPSSDPNVLVRYYESPFWFPGNKGWLHGGRAYVQVGDTWQVQWSATSPQFGMIEPRPWAEVVDLSPDAPGQELLAILGDQDVPPVAPTLILANDGTGTSFTATLGRVFDQWFRAIRYRNVRSDTWTVWPPEPEQELGAGTIQVPNLGEGGYEVEAFARNSKGVGASSVRKFVQVDDGTAEAFPVDPQEEERWRSRLARSSDRLVLHSRNETTAEFDPAAGDAVEETYDDLGGLSCTCPKGLPQEIVLSSNGKYALTDFTAFVLSADLLAAGVEPKPGDRATHSNTGDTFEVIGVSLRFKRAVWQLVLRKAD